MTGKADISDTARAVYDELVEHEIGVPSRDNIQQFRQNLIDGFSEFVDAQVTEFDGTIEQIEINGVSCRQITPRGWSESSDPVIQYAYGGGYVSGSTYEDQSITLPLATAANARVVMVDYRLSPEHPYPAAQLDMQAVYPALLETYGAERLIISGESAGGNQAVGLVQHVLNRNWPVPACLVVMSPWIDLTHGGASHDCNTPRDPTLNNAWVLSAAEMHANGHPLDDTGISPIFGSFADFPPTLITTGSCDLLLSHCLRLARKLHDAEVECDLRVWEGMWHVFEFYPIPEAPKSIAEMAEFIHCHLS